MTDEQLTRTELHAIRRRHVERKSWPLYRGAPNVEADGYRHWCNYCKAKWPCDAARLLAHIEERAPA